MPSPTEITVPQLARLIGTPQSPIIIDVRINNDFTQDPHILPTAKCHSHNEIHLLIPSLQNQSVIVYCQKGKKISQGSVAILREAGIQAESLEGGHFAWRDAKQPLISFDKLPKLNSQGRTVWVTKQRPKIDRIACPWLIRRFIDPQAQFLFVPPSEVLNVADKFDATPFDVTGAFWAHRGEQCTFDTMLDEFSLTSSALKHLAKIVRGADTNNHEIASESAGLLAASLGLSRMYKDDNEQLNAGMLLYDAFYRWARDATNEQHASQSGSQS